MFILLVKDTCFYKTFFQICLAYLGALYHVKGAPVLQGNIVISQEVSLLVTALNHRCPPEVCAVPVSMVHELTLSSLYYLIQKILFNGYHIIYIHLGHHL
jgi:hypothetical protein